LRIEPPAPVYLELPLHTQLPYTFNISSQAVAELPPVGEPTGWINVSYPLLGAKIYCSYLNITPTILDNVMEESYLIISRQAKNARAIQEQAYSNPDEHVYASLFQLDGGSASPIQFTVTDSVSHFFRGSLLYDSVINADSLAPVTQYIKQDVIEIIQSFSWN